MLYQLSQSPNTWHTLSIGHDRGGTSVQDIKYASLKDWGFAAFPGDYDHLFVEI